MARSRTSSHRVKAFIKPLHSTPWRHGKYMHTLSSCHHLLRLVDLFMLLLLRTLDGVWADPARRKAAHSLLTGVACKLLQSGGVPIYASMIRLVDAFKVSRCLILGRMGNEAGLLGKVRCTTPPYTATRAVCRERSNTIGHVCQPRHLEECLMAPHKLELLMGMLFSLPVCNHIQYDAQYQTRALCNYAGTTDVIIVIPMRAHMHRVFMPSRSGTRVCKTNRVPGLRTRAL